MAFKILVPNTLEIQEITKLTKYLNNGILNTIKQFQLQHDLLNWTLSTTERSSNESSSINTKKSIYHHGRNNDFATVNGLL